MDKGELRDVVSQQTNVTNETAGIWTIWTIEELSLTITIAGGFWEEWWRLTRMFNLGHFVAVY